MIGKRLRKTSQQLLLIFCILRKRTVSSSYLKNKFELWKKIVLLMIPNEEGEGWHSLAVKKLSALQIGIT